MPDTLTLDIPINQSPIPAALDAFYHFTKSLISVAPDERVALLGTIVEYHIDEKARLYNDYVVRAFADRTVSVSPIPAQGAGDRADRYSTRFVDMLTDLVASFDVGLSPADVAKIDKHKATIEATSQDRDAWLDRIDVAWAAKVQQLGIDPTKIDDDPAIRQRYYDEHVLFLTQRRFGQKLNEYNTSIRHEETSIKMIRLNTFPDDEARRIYSLYDYAVDDRVIRPKRPDLELIHHWDEFTIQDPNNLSMEGTVFDVGPGVDSIVDPRVILKGEGKDRSFSVDTHSTVTNEHDSDWNASGSGSYMYFLRGNIDTSSASHYRSTVSRVRQVDIGFVHTGELQIVRDNWFASTIFDMKRVKEYLKDKPTLARKLTLLVNSLIIGRGLTLTLHFTDSADVQEWGSSSTSGGGGFTVCGIGFGGGGGGSSSYNNHTINTTAQTVTFKDDPSVCRLLGVKVTHLSTGAAIDEVISTMRPLREVPRLLAVAQAMMASGAVPDRQAIVDAALESHEDKTC